MALRSQLRELFQDAQPGGGVITVEEPLSPNGASWVLRSPPASPPRGQGPLPKDCAVFQCRGCWAVLGDSLHLCAEEEQRLGLLVCFSQCPPGGLGARGRGVPGPVRRGRAGPGTGPEGAAGVRSVRALGGCLCACLGFSGSLFLLRSHKRRGLGGFADGRPGGSPPGVVRSSPSSLLFPAGKSGGGKLPGHGGASAAPGGSLETLRGFLGAR